MIYLCNAFSLSMLNIDKEIKLKVNTLTVDEVVNLVGKGFISAVGHDSTASVLTAQLGIDVATNRVNVKLSMDDILIVAQLNERLPEGVILTAGDLMTLKVAFLKVTII